MSLHDENREEHKVTLPTEEEVHSALRKRGLSKLTVGTSRNVPADLYYKIYGTSKEKLVLIQGLGGTANQYVPIISHMPILHI
jgi:hypothetical protein